MFELSIELHKKQGYMQYWYGRLLSKSHLLSCVFECAIRLMMMMMMMMMMMLMLVSISTAHVSGVLKETVLVNLNKKKMHGRTKKRKLSEKTWCTVV